MSQTNSRPPFGNNVPEELPLGGATRRDVMVLWTGILTGPLLWFAHQKVSFVLVPWVCSGGSRLWLHGTTLVCLAGAAAAGMLASRRWRIERKRRAGPWAAHEQRALFMATLGVFSSLFFGLVIIAQEIPNWLIDPCQR